MWRSIVYTLLDILHKILIWNGTLSILSEIKRSCSSVHGFCHMSCAHMTGAKTLVKQQNWLTDTDYSIFIIHSSASDSRVTFSANKLTNVEQNQYHGHLQQIGNAEIFDETDKILCWLAHWTEKNPNPHDSITVA